MKIRLAARVATLILVLGALSLATPAAMNPGDLDKADRYCGDGFKALDAGDIAKAKKNFDKALAIAPLFPDGHRGLGHLAMRDKRYEDALREYQAARSGYTELGELMFNIALQRYNDDRQRLPLLEKELVQLQGGGANNMNLSGTDRRFRIQDVQDQIRSIKNSSAPSHDNVSAPPAALDFDVGAALSRLGRWSEAVEAFETCVKKNSGLSAAYDNLALAYWRTGRVDDARKSLAKAEELGFPVNPKFKADLERAQPPSQPAPQPPAAPKP